MPTWAEAAPPPTQTGAPTSGGVPPPAGGRLRTGAEIAADSEWAMLHGRRLGVFSNPTGVLAAEPGRPIRHIVDDLAEVDRVEVAAVFGPEHGFRGSAQAGESEQDATDRRTGVPIVDAYTADSARMVELFADAAVDTVVFDMQDVGVRFYTYVWSMYRAMVAAARLSIGFVVLDRPNPLGRRIDGPMMRTEWTSGVGLKEIVLQHGMSIGELAAFFNGEFVQADAGAPADLSVVRMRGWRPDRPLPAVGVWPPPSPNLPTLTSALVYPGTGLFEGTNLSEGRGTTIPFEMVGAPFCDPTLADRLAAYDLPGVAFREAHFAPTFGDHRGSSCTGVQLHPTDPETFQAVGTGVAMLVEAHRSSGFAWRRDSWDPDRPYWIDKLTGSPRLRTMIDAGADAAEVTDGWRDEVADFERRRRPYLMYEGDAPEAGGVRSGVERVRNQSPTIDTAEGR